ncbi:4a-hydroxytetrahydrobiopterin dehydratase [Vibrio xiamenensis]|uniref:Putative pterin-4-alpha-carbinolamine dehydratase n=1 Tax=Vibrio xiamenensis TaxID=861298 RepID=A0A1G8A374_9VIBR|nr:4a-hydroxytetrahydrobiopterin dehydratase [Vibrio xiamenensis]SDH15402.1 4a-hydroxytetrahydrobiopterin dehydratase [Vibrio xiamenensis]
MLEQLTCEACSKGAEALNTQQQQRLLAELRDWQICVREGIPQLEKVFVFKNFKLAWAFADQVAHLAEAQFHHPSILLEWGKVTVTWWSHSLKGLHRNDFICAAKCDALQGLDC